MSHRYLAVHPRQYRPLPLGLIELWLVRSPLTHRVQLLRARTTRAIRPPARSLGATVYMAHVNAHWAGGVVENALAELRAREAELAECGDDTEPMSRVELFGLEAAQ